MRNLASEVTERPGGKGIAAAMRALPPVGRVLGWDSAAALVAAHGRAAVVEAVRAELNVLRQAIRFGARAPGEAGLVGAVANRLEAMARPSLRPVFNLTGTVLHTNLGRAPLPEAALRAMTAVARGACTLEYDLESGKRGDRDSHVESLIRALTGAEAATLVNNTAAALLLILNEFAHGKDVPVSRGELIEIGGSFRLPAIMARAGCRLVEIGATNRTHLHDYSGAIGADTALLLKVHTSNYAIQGFTKAVPEPELAALAQENDLPFVVDLGSGQLVDLARWGLPHEPTVAETIAGGADLVAFSTDKLLGGPQGGIVAGRKDLVARLKQNPMKRALRCDKLTVAVLEAVLRLYADPDRLAQRLPTLRLLTRPRAEIADLAERLLEPVAAALPTDCDPAIQPCKSQIGSGALPVETLESAAIVIRPAGKRGVGARLEGLAAALRGLPIPVVGRIAEDALWLDLRCLEDEAAFAGQLPRLGLAGGP